MSSTPYEGDDRLVRPYVVTRGRSGPSRNHFDHTTLISLSDAARHLSRSQLDLEHVALLDALVPSAQSVAELSAFLHQPLSVVRILLADLMEAGYITTQRHIPHTAIPDRKLLEDVLAGLRNL